MNEIMETLSAAKTSKKDGKGNRYVELMRGHVPLIDAACLLYTSDAADE